MTIIHGMETLPRLVGTALREGLRVTPAAVACPLMGVNFC